MSISRSLDRLLVHAVDSGAGAEPHRALAAWDCWFPCGVPRPRNHRNADIAIFMFFYGASLYFWRGRLFLNLWTFARCPFS